jgi:hypothetical protein
MEDQDTILENSIHRPTIDALCRRYKICEILRYAVCGDEEARTSHGANKRRYLDQEIGIQENAKKIVIF